MTCFCALELRIFLVMSINQRRILMYKNTCLSSVFNDYGFRWISIEFNEDVSEFKLSSWCLQEKVGFGMKLRLLVFICAFICGFLWRKMAPVHITPSSNKYVKYTMFFHSEETSLIRINDSAFTWKKHPLLG